MTSLGGRFVVCSGDVIAVAVVVVVVVVGAVTPAAAAAGSLENTSNINLPEMLPGLNPTATTFLGDLPVFPCIFSVYAFHRHRHFVC